MGAATSPIDTLYIILYLAIIILLGYISSRKTTNEGFLIADRKLDVFTNTSTILASKTGAGVLLTFVALVYLYGISAIWVFIGASFGYISFLFFAVKLKRLSSEHKFYTLSDYFFHKYGKTAGYTSAGIMAIVMLFFLLVNFIGGTKVVANLTGLPYTASLLIICITVLIYMILGGFKAVVKTDIAQLLAIVFLAGMLGFIMTNGAALSQISTSFATEKTTPLKSIISFFVIGILLPFFSAELWQRIYAARDVNTVRRSLILSAILYPMIGGLMAIIGLAISRELSGIDPDTALITGFSQLLPAGFFGLALVALFAAIMSSADSYLFANISILLQDFYARFKSIENAKLVVLFRYAILVFILLMFILSIWLKSIISSSFITLAFGSIIALTCVVSWLYKNVNKITLITGMVVGFWGTLYFIIFSPIGETLVLKSAIFTISGFLAGSAMNFAFKKQPVRD